MIINIISTPEVPKKLVNNVFNELNFSKGIIQYQILPSISDKQFYKLQSIANIDLSESVTFEKFFIICENVRLINNLADSDIVILLTSIRNEKKWFSATKGKNIFVDVNDWEKYTGKDARFGIAYQVIENLFQSLLNLDCDNASNSPYIHLESIGCINDFCQKKKEVILKLRTADICEDCVKRAKSLKIKNNIILQIIDSIEHIRNNIRSVIELKMVEPEVLKIDKKCKITIGVKEINPPGLPKTLFVFFLNELNGIELQNLSNHEIRLIKIYNKIKPTGEEKSIIKMAKPHKFDNTFFKYKSDLNKYLINKLGDKLADYYTINKDKELIYKIRISSKHLKLDIKF